MKPNFNFEIEFSKQYGVVAGVDEVGRGALAGPIVASAVVFSNYSKIKKSIGKIRDSKILTPPEREVLDKIIRSEAADFAIGEVSVEEIDKFGIGAANVMAFKRALDGLKKCDFALIDGRRFHGLDRQFVCLEKGESKSISIAAASIIAKVYRDHLMSELKIVNNLYDFSSNKGYGCKKHFEDLEKYGLSEYHRKSFLNCMEKESQTLF